MKKTVTLGIVSAFSAFILLGCSATTSSPESHTGEMHKKSLTQEKVKKIIQKAGEDAGWMMTEFKSNSLIAEKIDNGASKSVTVTFDKSYFDLSPENSELKSIISDALK